jgi:hypothetical protein
MEVAQSLSTLDFLWQKLLGDSGIVGLVNLLLVFTILYIERQRFAIAQKAADYSELDGLYMSILQQRVERPWLADPRVAATEYGVNETLAREARRVHAYMVWTMLESIRDRLQGRESFRRAGQRVWQPILRAEGTRFLGELRAFWQEERTFQDYFIDFVRAGGFQGIYRPGSPDDLETRRFRDRAQAVLGPVGAR